MSCHEFFLVRINPYLYKIIELLYLINEIKVMISFVWQAMKIEITYKIIH